ncbi:MAG: J domain-containing protein [Marmoricola sp.]
MSEPTHYEVLGVRPSATPEAIRRAWRRRTGKAGPGSPELARLNEAAEVLLDPEARRHYDETLAPAAVPQVEPGEIVAPEPERPTGRLRASLVAALALLAVLTVAAVVVAVVLSLHHRTDVAVDTARQEATAAAERALPQVLSYDYRSLPQAQAEADRYLTPSFRTQVDRNFRLLQKNPDGSPGAAVQTKTVVKASVLGTAVMQADPDRVQVLAYVDQHRTGVQGTEIFQNRVAVTMVQRAGAWLIDRLDPR